MEVATIAPAINQVRAVWPTIFHHTSHFSDREPSLPQVQFHVGMGAAGVNATDMPFPRKIGDQPSYKGIAYQAFSSLCGPCQTAAGAPDKELVDGPFVAAIGKKHGKSAAQVSPGPASRCCRVAPPSRLK